jgi:lipoprotein-releasing system permease protein
VRFELFMALRFLREGRAQSWLIFVGASAGVAVIIFLTALIDGLQVTLIDQTLGSQAHVVVRPLDESARPLDGGGGASALVEVKTRQRTASIPEWQPLAAAAAAVPRVVAVAPSVAGSAFATQASVSKSVALRGIDAETYGRIIPIAKHLVQGQFRLSGRDALVGVELASDLGLRAGDKLRLVVAGGRDEVFTISGVFDLGQKDVNQRWVFVPLGVAQTLLDLPGRVTTLELRIDDVFAADAVALEVSRRTGLTADSWMKINQQLMIGLRSQSSSSYMIQFFVVLAVALGIASVLVVSVVQKGREIGILKAFGTPTRTVMRIFLIQGAIVGLAGSLIGSVMATGLAAFFVSLATNPDGSPRFPVTLGPGLYLSASAFAMLVGVLAALAPARRAAKLDPVVVIRYG